MKRNTLFIVLTAGCVALSGCSSSAADSPDTHPATPPPSASTTVHDAASGTPPADSTAADPGTTAVQMSRDPSLDPPPPDAGGPSSPPDPPDQADPAQEGSAPAPDGQTNPLDQNSVRWFDTFCSTMTTVIAVRDDTALVNVGDAASMQSALIGSLTTLGEAFNTSTSTIAGLTPPGVTGGKQLASTITTAFQQYGQRFTASAATLAAADPEDTLAQAKATTNLDSDTQQAIGLTNAVTSLDLNIATRTAIQAIPSCQTLVL